MHPAATHAPEPFPSVIEDGAVLQHSLLDALLVGDYDGGITVEEVLAAADLGLGCGDQLDGEVVIVDGQAYRCTSDGRCDPMPAHATLPFAQACPFPSGVPGRRIASQNMAAISATVERGLASTNLFHGIRLDGRFARVRVRAAPRQHLPYRPLAEVAREQVEAEHENLSGTVVGFWAPSLYQGIAVAGLHLHVVDDARRVGGHVLGIEVAEAELRIAAFARVDLRLPTDERFLTTRLSHEDDDAIASIESR